MSREKLILIALLLAGCASNPHIKPLQYYPEGFGYPVVFGSAAGLPPGYSLNLEYDFEGKNGETMPASVQFKAEKEDLEGGAMRFSGFVEPGRIKVKKIVFTSYRTHQKKMVLEDAKKDLAVALSMEGTDGITIDAVRDGVLYLGRWQFEGFEGMDSVTSPVIARIDSGLTKNDTSFQHVLGARLSFKDDQETDVAIFRKRHPKFAKKGPSISLPSVPFAGTDGRVEISIAEIKADNPVHFNHVHHEFMKPQIPRF